MAATVALLLTSICACAAQGPFFDGGFVGGGGGFGGFGGFQPESPKDFASTLGAFHTALTLSPQDRFQQLIGVGSGGGGGQCAAQGPQGCDPHQKYRTIDGTCNNVYRPGLGAAQSTYSRLLGPKYSGANRQPAVSVTGHSLPPARTVSWVLFPDNPIHDPIWTLVAMQWGQIMTHDMSMAAGTSQAKAHRTQCCASDGSHWSLTNEPTCYPIIIDEKDPVFGPAGIRCMNFVRTTADACSHHASEQLSAVTSYLDASLVYGSDDQTAANLRLFQKGLLRTDTSNHGRHFPPAANNKSAACDTASDGESCYAAGDQRVNQNTQLTVLQVILLREHNRIASTLAHLNPHWDDEKIYQEARRILIAEHQHISYWEWLPIFLGWETVKTHNVLSYGEGYAQDYDHTADPRVINEHATAAFRYFHSNIQGYLHLVTEHRDSFSALRLSDHFNRPEIIEQGDNFDDLVRGLSSQPQENVDQYFTKEITWYLFRNGKPLGQDLRAIDIQRGRDHGLASYNEARHHCSLRKAHSWEDFLDVISAENVEKLSKLYEHPDDVDLTVGGSLEVHVQGALAGPTFVCIMAEQFRRTRQGDRFFYDFKDAGFTPDQLQEIRKANMARLLCDNSDHVKSMQPRAFEKINHGNPIVPCDSLPAVDLSAWQESGGDGGHGGESASLWYFKK
ncbi:peroxidase-like [Schistocerca nitens]|uniref:peroxidase-like n=1 Tax=Schistocerca nitens TaxID=7011 RepID=UPI0021174103|nr:peroxidase-like [Schistocerca nitens]